MPRCESAVYNLFTRLCVGVGLVSTHKNTASTVSSFIAQNSHVIRVFNTLTPQFSAHQFSFNLPLLMSHLYSVSTAPINRATNSKKG